MSFSDEMETELPFWLTVINFTDFHDHQNHLIANSTKSSLGEGNKYKGVYMKGWTLFREEIARMHIQNNDNVEILQMIRL
jgi:hypothetical protein